MEKTQTLTTIEETTQNLTYTVKLQNPTGYLRAAEQADALLAARGESLFPVNGELRMTELLDRHYIPQRLFQASPATLEYMRIAVKKWAAATGNPPLSKIDGAMLVLFRNFLAACRGMKPGSRASTDTIAGQLRQIQTLLTFAGPPGPHARDSLGLLDRVPWIRPPRLDTPAPRSVPFEHLSAVYEAAAKMLVPQVEGIAPADWWRALFVFTFNTGLRRRSLFSLQWDDIDLERRTVTVNPDKIKTRRAHVEPLNDLTCAHLSRIRADFAGDARLFPWPYCKRHFDSSLQRLQYTAGLPLEQHFGLHRIRKTNATAMWEDSPAAAQLVMGHTTAGMTAKRYVQGAGIMREAVERMRQPEAFTA